MPAKGLLSLQSVRRPCHISANFSEGDYACALHCPENFESKWCRQACEAGSVRMQVGCSSCIGRGLESGCIR